jgi:hypothetical protein
MKATFRQPCPIGRLFDNSEATAPGESQTVQDGTRSEGLPLLPVAARAIAASMAMIMQEPGPQNFRFPI